MGSFDIAMFVFIILWIAIKIRTGYDIYQPIGIMIYGFILVLRRIAESIYKASTGYARKTATVLVENMAAIRLHPYEVSLGKVGSRDFVVDIMGRHNLIGATSGGGKTYLLHSILKQLFDKGRLFFDNTDIYLIDLKGHEDDMLHLWQPLLSGYATRVGSDMDDAIRLLTEIEAKLGQKLDRRILLIVDEVHILTSHKEGDRLLQNIASQLRLNGALILLVQHSQYAIVKTFIRYNIERRICGLVMSRDQAKVILDIRPRDEELPVRIGEYLIREPGKTQLVKVTSEKLNLPDDIEQTIKNVLAVKSEDLPQMKLLIDIVGTKKKDDQIAGVRNVASTLDIPNAQNYTMVAYRNFTSAGIFEPPRTRGGRYKLAVNDVNEAIRKLQEYLPNWMDAPDSFIDKEGQ